MFEEDAHKYEDAARHAAIFILVQAHVAAAESIVAAHHLHRIIHTHRSFLLHTSMTVDNSINASKSQAYDDDGMLSCHTSMTTPELSMKAGHDSSSELVAPLQAITDKSQIQGQAHIVTALHD